MHKRRVRSRYCQTCSSDLPGLKGLGTRFKGQHQKDTNDGERGTAERASVRFDGAYQSFPYRGSLGSACLGTFINSCSIRSTDEVCRLLKKALYCQQKTEGKVFHIRIR